ncbi:histidine kinase [Intrasporangium calvum]|uniref:histidine kinase n=1 Tax=Intrasporangium calvum TaxID=53358 RepID=A0ABT5GGU2_9MICO|nr:sensor histidine kinase [Intrasporangium calvum]MDC5697475.1 histidine kinase [Intrasporangium calvum]
MTRATRDDRPLARPASVLADLALAAALAALLLTASLGALADSDLAGTWRAAVVAALVIIHVAVAGRSRWPVAGFVATSTGMLVLALAPDFGGRAAVEAGSPYSPLLLPSGLLFFVVLYTVSARAPAPVPTLALGVSLAGAVITVARLWDTGEFVSTPVSGALAWRMFVAAAVSAGVLAAWSLGRYRATRLAWVAALEERAVRAERERQTAIVQARADLEQEAERAAAAERRRIAREMHDVVAHSLAVMVGQAEGGRMMVGRDPDRAGPVLATVAEQGRQALTELRSLLGVLRDEETVPTRPQPRLDELDGLVDEVRRAGLSVDVVERGTRHALPATADLTAFRVVQESLTNVVKHAGPGASATVALDWLPNRLQIRVSDDGSRREKGEADGIPGRGLVGMRERLDLVGGTLVHSGPDPTGRDGFIVEAHVPTPAGHHPTGAVHPPTEGTTS